MNWKEWTKFPDIEGEKVRALRALVFREVLQKKEIKSSWSIPPIKVSTLITARSVLFFVYNDNKPTTWNALETYLTEKYGYSTGTVYGQHQHLLSYLIESTGISSNLGTRFMMRLSEFWKTTNTLKRSSKKQRNSNGLLRLNSIGDIKISKNLPAKMRMRSQLSLF